ncbi:multidrug efflux SMR transporter [Sutterella massiliensis]|uniref:Guanidinium exporter n=1 Tax=Sutterella massiliensis TaxID=1816689 RepID=A0ABS2DU78_9BURK|nr:multidrug efflux SMR transporter [Sutterella massiliensis]MBM6704275.1 multidrug efflux SMR transporter [Sutterella massiliensis]
MAWACVLIAGILEVFWSFSLKASEGFTKLGPSAATIVFMILSFVVLAQGMKSLPLGTAYAVWTGIGAVGSALAGILILGESASILRVSGIAAIVVGIVCLKLAH